ncbi:hypothetical protein VCRA2123O444_320037 [Vibrio crassostreae]|uniref:glycosyltransferase family 4 protein n=1 Tax=Vibrio crassostreae TaxID=246167 RepID=UPI001B310606|nr:glycosyltransferase family 4 protein [Vibrio crassostreae]CAK1935250.1 hypothetical protein VCRA2118O429_250013 [Vibrio crassostreae]CAK1940539.1 hypothetical protein VCRA2113O412_260013 [Vibrio crassostreae]CAK1941144.1 hypothetical protein VCRA2113O413_260013 [Vibrio crassostreae]CAK1944854.1 hypothetical protein VCRA2119O432_260060 [Vibrio crassostreae]CAK1945890.1 hypothetical protein VCRA2114O423_260059 [Vibrio crassostreae]
MRVLIVSPTFLPHAGGCAKSTKYLYEGIADTYDSELLIVSKNKYLERENISYLRLEPKSIVNFLRIVMSIRKIVKNRNIDIVHVYNVFMIPHVNLATLGMKCRVFGTLNNLNWGCVNPNYYSKHRCTSCDFIKRRKCTSFAKSVQFSLGTSLLSYADRLFCFSQVFKNIYSMQGVPKNKLIKIQNFKSDDENKGRIIKSVSNNSKIKFIFIGNIDERKGIHILYDAFSYIKSKHCGFSNKVELVVLGGGEQSYIKRFNELHDVTCKLIEPDSKEFYNEISCSDVLIHPAICNEAFARVWIEASMHGLALISSDTDSAKELLSNHAVYYNKFSSDSLVESIECLVDNRDYLIKLKESSRVWFDNLLSNQEVIDSIIKEYRKC